MSSGDDLALGRSTRGGALEGVDGGKENSLAMTLLWFFVWLIANLIGDEEGLTFDPVNFWAGWLLLALALDLAGAHATEDAYGMSKRSRDPRRKS